MKKYHWEQDQFKQREEARMKLWDKIKGTEQPPMKFAKTKPTANDFFPPSTTSGNIYAFDYKDPFIWRRGVNTRVDNYNINFAVSVVRQKLSINIQLHDNVDGDYYELRWDTGRMKISRTEVATMSPERLIKLIERGVGEPKFTGYKPVEKQTKSGTEAWADEWARKNGLGA